MMKQSVLSSLIWLMMLAPIGVFIRQISKVRSGLQSKVKGTALCFAYSIAPTLAYIMVFATLVGIEELMDTPMVTEGFARSLAFVVGLAFGEVVLLTSLFALVVWLYRGAKNAA